MRRRFYIWLVLLGIHVGALLWGWVIGGKHIAAVVAASIYYPLLPLEMLGLPVLRQASWIFAPPSGLGWAIVALIWVIFYWYLAAFLCHSSRRSTRLDEQ